MILSFVWSMMTNKDMRYRFVLYVQFIIKALWFDWSVFWKESFEEDELARQFETMKSNSRQWKTIRDNEKQFETMQK